MDQFKDSDSSQSGIRAFPGSCGVCYPLEDRALPENAGRLAALALLPMGGISMPFTSSLLAGSGFSLETGRAPAGWSLSEPLVPNLSGRAGRRHLGPE